MKFYLSLLFTLIFGGFMMAAMIAAKVWYLQAIFGLLVMLSLIFLFFTLVQELTK